MGDTKEGREKQARSADDRQREREIEESIARGDEAEPPESEVRTCHRRGCDEPAAFVVTERYLEETGHGAVEATAYLCRDHTAEEGPANLDRAFSDYVFRVEPVSE
jgi:hypothetical protein